MRVVVSNLSWLDKAALSEADQFLIKKRLTLIPKMSGFEEPDEEGNIIQPTIEMWRETETQLGVPRFFYAQNKRGVNEEIDEVAQGVPLRCERNPAIVLRPDDQAPLVDQMMRVLTAKMWGGVMMEAFTGAGKSIMAMEVQHRLNCNSILLVHKEPLADQWEKNIKWFFPNAKVGRVQGDRCDYRGYDVVIGMIQSMMGDRGDKYPAEMYRHFGLLMVDEVHRAGAPAFCSVAPRFAARYTLGISGTIRRKDGCEDAFLWTLGTEKCRISEKNRLNPIVYVRETGFQAVKREYTDKKTGERKVWDMNAYKKPTQLGFITDSDHRNKLIAYDVVQALKAGRQPLVMSERLEMLDKIRKEVAERAAVELGRTVTQGMYIGGLSKEALAKASQCEVVYATVQLAKEGIDIPRLDTLFVASPQSDIEQDVGRICRTLPGKKTPMVVDYIDSSLDTFKGIFYSRLKLYKRLGWQVLGLK